MDKKNSMEKKLQGVPETMLIPLWARAEESKQADPIIRDDMAEGLISRIDYDFSRFKDAWLTQVGVSIRTMLLDKAVCDFLQQRPSAVIVNLGAGLDTRYERLKDDSIIHRWYDLDLPEAIGLRRRFFNESDGNTCIAKSVFDDSWFDDVKAEGRPILIIAEGLFMYFTEDEVAGFFRRMVARLPDAEMFLEVLAPVAVGKSRHHDSVSKIGSSAEFKWGMKDSRKIEQWHEGIRFLKEWNYYDYHRKRWKWFGVVGRLPLIRPLLSSRIVHLEFV